MAIAISLFVVRNQHPAYNTVTDSQNQSPPAYHKPQILAIFLTVTDYEACETAGFADAEMSKFCNQ
ncbi:MAG TPA: hypothetical protein PLY87_24455, partial [Planctomycetaceae bacterium]|nr:hypothetical protein [Planctomycetaceae bacterium]HQZ68273.1 hypothetical protein [Planctomycetaceae bacterium]